MSGVPVTWYLILSAILFALGVAGFVFRRNIITVFMSIELMLNAVNLSFIDVLLPVQTSERPSVQLLRDGGGRGRSSGRPGHHPDGVQESQHAQYR